MTRKQERVGLIYQLRLFDAGTGSLIGHIINLTGDGFLVVAESPVTPHAGFSLRMDLPRSVMRERSLSFSAECMWSRRDSSGDFFNVGFRITDMTRKTMQTILRLIRRFPAEEVAPEM
jgi:hypothetical protein